MPTSTSTLDRATRKEIQRCLEAGEVAIIPTATTYAAIADASNPEAIAKIGRLKQWNVPKPLGILTSPNQADAIAHLNPACRQLMSAWPDAVSILVHKKDSIDDRVTAGSTTLLLICPDRDVQNLAEAIPFPIAGVSASLSIDNPTVNYTTAARLFADKVPLIVDGGQCRYGAGSTLVDCRVDVPTVVQFGPVSVEALRQVVPNVQLASHMMK